MPDLTVNLTGGELSDSEMATLMETGIACEEEGDDADNAEDEAAADAAAAALAAANAAELINPVTGAIVSIDDIDSLILGCDECKRLLDDLNTFYSTLREHAWSKTAGETKTRRLKGKKYQAKLEEGYRSPSSSITKEIWNSYPQFRDQYLRIGKVDLQMREVGKLKSMTSDDPAFDNFKTMIEDAIAKGSVGLPTVSLEQGAEA